MSPVLLPAVSPREPPGHEESDLRAHLNDIIVNRRLTALFQPIVDMRRGTVLGYEGLIRGPSDSPLHSPIPLFKTAEQYGLSVPVEHLCRRVVIEEFVGLGLQQQLFLNVSPESLVQRDARHGETLHLLRDLGLASERVVIELTENQPSYDYQLIRQAIAHYRAMGFRIAIDDLGEGFSSLRRWSELRPEFVKIDMHFIQGIDRDPVKHQFVHSLHEMARSAGSHVIAEGIETEQEFAALHRLGLQFGQGYFFGRPTPAPSAELPAPAKAALAAPRRQAVATTHAETAGSLARSALYVDPNSRVDAVYTLFLERPELTALPVVDRGVPLGLLVRNQVLTRMAGPYGRDLYGRRPCHLFMDPRPLVFEASLTVQVLGQEVAAADPRHLADGFIVVKNGQFLGYGTGHDLMRAITAHQLEFARSANPLTGLPGNLVLGERIDALLAAREPFVACYFDLDHFKPFNDLFGYARGDEAIIETANALIAHADPLRDFVAHVGGDDFIVLYRDGDWEARCRAAIADFAAAVRRFFSAEMVESGGYLAENRDGVLTHIPLLTLSAGAVVAAPGRFPSHTPLATAAAAAKSKAKRRGGNSLFLAEA